MILLISFFLSIFFLTLPSLTARADYYRGEHMIGVNPSVPLHKQPLGAIYALRKARIDENRILGIFPERYQPLASIFGQIDEKAEWVPDTQFFVPNPYLLVVISSGNKVNAFLPYCELKAVEYSHRKICETYRAHAAQKWFFFAFDYYGDFKGIIRLWFVNAYDAGFKYANIDLLKSRNVDVNYPQSEGSLVNSIYSGHEFFHVGHLKKNNISSYDVRATVKLRQKNVASLIYVKLWRNRPADKSGKEDFAYVFKIEP